ncbi:hypothetical protein HK102_003295 [Quaeritorhiza haematococci]|nr:hypothetical protein HK102_003295 [Quaeritorhiza haematococci]
MAAGTAQYMLKNGSFGLALLIALSGRVILLSFLTKMFKHHKSSSASPSNSHLKPIYLSYAASITRRSFRLAAPIFFIALMQQQLCLGGVLDVALEAREFLRNEALGVPYWCRVDNIWKFFLELFTYPNPQYLLDLGSALWSMFVFLWGSYYSYIIGAIVAHVPSLAARMCIHVTLIFFGALTYNFNMIFTLGILIADLDASGILKKLQKGRWYMMLTIKLCLVTLALSLLLTDVVVKAVDYSLVPYIVREGVLGGPGGVVFGYWPILVNPSNWIAAMAVLMWIELSPTTQWIVANPLFTILGKYSFGIYCLHNVVLYAIVTRLVLKFRDLGLSYWTNMTVTYILFVLISFIFAVVFYNIVDKPVQKFANSSFNYLFKPNQMVERKGTNSSTGTTAAESPKSPFRDLVELPARLVKTVKNSPNTSRKLFSSWVDKWQKRLAHWGTNISWTFKIMTGQKTDDTETAQLAARLKSVATAEEDTFIDPDREFHSTEWQFRPFSKSSSDPEDPNNTEAAYTRLLGKEAAQQAKRTARLLGLYRFGFLVHLMVIGAAATSWSLFNPVGKSTLQLFTFTSLWRIVWLFTLPYTLITFASLCYPRIPPSPKRGKTADNVTVDDTRPVIRPFLRNFYILTVTKGSNDEAVRYSYSQMKDFEKLHPAIRVVILSDEPYAFPDLRNVVVPKEYRTDEGKGKYKARALDYFRKHMRLTRYDWTLHMDEESTIDAESLRQCFEFIRFDKADWGQGVILYNSNKGLYWKNPYFAIADAIRVGDDLARFHIQYTLFRRPIFGAHGSFLLLNGQVENIVTWDFATLAEDFEFSHKAWELGYTCGPIHGFVREQSPQTIRDFMKQRRRWYMGIRDLNGMYGLPRMGLILWTIGVYGLIGTLVNIPFSFWVDGGPTPIWLALAGNFNFACLYWLYLFGVLFQEIDNGTALWLILMRALVTLVMQPFVTVAEAASVIWALKSEDKGKFEVIKK